MQFVCNVCGKNFKYKQGLKDHNLLHSGKFKTALRCVFCSKGFANQSALWRHITLHTRERPYFCTVCFAEKNSRGNLLSHLQLHNPNRTKDKTCEKCGKCFYTDLEVKLHGRVHKSERPFECEVCKKKFKTRGDLRAHKTVHSKVKGYSCNICGKAFSRKETLNNHVVTHTGESRNKYSCDLCSKKFCTVSNLNGHILRIHNPKKEFKCKICERQFMTVRELKCHFLMHSGRTPFACNLCSMNFKTKEELRRHKSAPGDLNGHGQLMLKLKGRVIPAPSNGTAAQCIFCHRKFRDSYNLDGHILSHIKEQAYSCNRCSFETSYAGNFRSHLATHNSDRTRDFKCDVCGRKFFTAADCKLHRARHSNEKALRCLTCLKCFKTKYELGRHSIVHTNLKSFACPICDKRFKNKNGLAYHLFTHTGENRDRFECTVCPAKFSYKGCLNTHLKTIHNPNRRRSFKCDECHKGFFTADKLQRHIMAVHPR